MSGEVRLHRSVSLDQMAEFDSNTGLWHSDGTVEVVRFNEVLPTDDAKHITHIALPAAEFEAWGRVVGCARVLRGAEAMGDRQARGGALVALIAAVDALPPEAQQPGRAGGGA